MIGRWAGNSQPRSRQLRSRSRPAAAPQTPRGLHGSRAIFRFADRVRNAKVLLRRSKGCHDGVAVKGESVRRIKARQHKGMPARGTNAGDRVTLLYHAFELTPAAVQPQSGSGAGRERGCQYVWISVFAET